MKKTLAILLSLALVICMIPATAFAGSVSLENNVSLSETSSTYDGTAKTPAVQVGIEGITASDYTVSYTKEGAPVSEIKEAGTYTVTVTAVNSEKCTGTGTVTYTVNALNLADAGVKITEKAGKPITSETVTADNIDVTYNGKAITDGFEVTSAVSTSDKSTVLVTIKAAGKIGRAHV